LYQCDIGMIVRDMMRALQRIRERAEITTRECPA
jgi:hypothetical protein